MSVPTKEMTTINLAIRALVWGAIILFVASVFSLLIIAEFSFTGAGLPKVAAVAIAYRHFLQVLSGATLLGNVVIVAVLKRETSSKHVFAIALALLALILFGLPSFFG